MRPSKLRLPDRTAATTRSFASIALGDLRVERAAVADARRAAVADDAEAELLERLEQARGLVVLGHRARARRERRLDRRLDASGRGRSRSGRAARRRSSPSGCWCWCRLVIAAMATEPWSIVASARRCPSALTVDRVALRRCADRPRGSWPAGRAAGPCPAAGADRRRWARSVDRSSSSVSSKSGPAPGSRHRPFSLVYASTSATMLVRAARSGAGRRASRRRSGRARPSRRTRATCSRSSPGRPARARRGRRRRTRRTSRPRRARGACG